MFLADASTASRVRVTDLSPPSALRQINIRCATAQHGRSESDSHRGLLLGSPPTERHIVWLFGHKLYKRPHEMRVHTLFVGLVGLRDALLLSPGLAA